VKIKDKLQELLNQGFENELTEFKEAKTQYDFNKLGKYFSALSNEANLKNKSSAWLVFGIRDKDKHIVGSKFRTKGSDLQSLKAEIANHTTNRITFIEIYEVTTSNSRVVMFKIPPAPKGIPIAWKGHYYGRDGEAIALTKIEPLLLS
jgi:ATP-dependent DNA helicase RecG